MTLVALLPTAAIITWINRAMKHAPSASPKTLSDNDVPAKGARILASTRYQI